MKATILTIGDEILIGQIVDTNSVSIAKHLNTAGIVVREKISIGDDRTQILDTVSRALHDSEVTVITGGLGPTKDDITKKTLAELFGCGMHYDETVAAHVEQMLTRAVSTSTNSTVRRRSSPMPARYSSTPTARPRACGSNATDTSSSRSRASPTRWST